MSEKTYQEVVLEFAVKNPKCTSKMAAAFLKAEVNPTANAFLELTKKGLLTREDRTPTEDDASRFAYTAVTSPPPPAKRRRKRRKSTVVESSPVDCDTPFFNFPYGKGETAVLTINDIKRWMGMVKQFSTLIG